MYCLKYILILFALFLIKHSSLSQDSSLVKYVNPLIGTQSSKDLSHGNTLPLVARPFGMTYFTPQTAISNTDGWIYTYDFKTISSFRATRLPSPWMSDYGSFSLYPSVGNNVVLDEKERASEYSHQNETATPFSYKVKLDKHQITTEFTATERCAYFKFKYPKTKSANLILDAFHGGSSVKIIPEENKIIGVCRNSSGNTPNNFSGFFVAVFSKQFRPATWSKDSIYLDNLEITGERVGALLKFVADTSENIFIKIGTSLISEEQAELNLMSEIGDKNFETVKAQSKAIWEAEMQKIEIQGANPSQKINFYTAFYRTLLFPRMVYEINEDSKPQYYSAFDGKIHEGIMYADNGLWDTFRAVFPFFSILYPNRHQEICQALVNAYKQGGWLPRWLNPGYAEGMIGAHAASILTDAYTKGLKNFDYKTAYEAMLKDANQVRPNIHEGREGLNFYNKLGYVPTSVGESVSKTLEYAYDDFCIYQMAKQLGKYKDTALYKSRALNYINTFDAHTNMMRPKNTDGSWLEHFRKHDWGGYYTEGNAWHWVWSVIHDPQGLINLMGGKDNFAMKMDSVFSQAPLYDFHHYGFLIHEITEMLNAKMGQYAHGNQPMQHFIYLYNHAGQPWKTQYWARQIMNKLYQPIPAGLCGDEDNGQTSAWYLLSALGLYQVCPGQPEFVLGSPLFQKATVHLPNGNNFEVEAQNNQLSNYYIQSACLNGVPSTKTYITYQELINGGKLKYTMSATPNKSWGNKESDAPFSLSKYKAVSIPYTEYHGGYFLHNIHVPLHCRTAGAEIRYTTDGSEPTEKSTLYQKPVHLHKSTNVKAKAFKLGFEPSVTLNLNFKNDLLPADTTSLSLTAGLTSKLYEDIQDGFPDFDALQPSRTEIVDKISINQYKGKDNFGIVMEGYIKFPEDGLYTFFMKNIDEEARLYIDNELAIEAHHRHGKHEHRHKLAIQNGLHKIRLEYIEIKGTENLYIGFKHHGIGQHHAIHTEQHEIPSQWLFRTE